MMTCCETPATGVRQYVRRFFLLGDNPSRNTAMEGLRGYAALLVVILHSTANFPLLTSPSLAFQTYTLWPWQICRHYSPSETVMILISRSYYAVELFFLLSGFLIMRILMRDGQRQDFSYARYMKKRVLRIYPTFLCSLLFGMVVSIGVLHKLHFSLRDLIYNLVFLNGCPYFPWKFQRYLGTSWSLFYEFLFYLTIPCLFLLGQRLQRKGIPLELLRPLTILALVMLTTTVLPRFAMFYFGVLLASVDEQSLKQLSHRISTASVLFVYVAACMVYTLFTPSWQYFVPLYGVASSLLFVNVCYGEGILSRFFSTSLMRACGNISYSLYLVHLPCLAMLSRALSKVLTPLPVFWAYPIFLAACLFVSLAAAILLFAVSERWYFPKTKPVLTAPEALDSGPVVIPIQRREAA